jgi:hypothetical protein
MNSIQTKSKRRATGLDKPYRQPFNLYFKLTFAFGFVAEMDPSYLDLCGPTVTWKPAVLTCGHVCTSFQEIPLNWLCACLTQAAIMAFMSA